MMRVIPTRIHGYLDYLGGIILIAAPWLFGFADGDTKQWVPIFFGAWLILYSLMTNYEVGIFKMIPMPTHLMIGLVSGALLAISPWVFGFADEIWWSHVLVGGLEIVVSLLTERVPGHDDAVGVNHHGRLA
jgi:hypothetical protein